MSPFRKTTETKISEVQFYCQLIFFALSRNPITKLHTKILKYFMLTTSTVTEILSFKQNITLTLFVCKRLKFIKVNLLQNRLISETGRKVSGFTSATIVYQATFHIHKRKLLDEKPILHQNTFH